MAIPSSKVMDTPFMQSAVNIFHELRMKLGNAKQQLLNAIIFVKE